MDPQDPIRPTQPVMDVASPPRPRPNSVVNPGSTINTPTMAPADNIASAADQSIPPAPMAKPPKKKHTGLIVAIVTTTVVLLVATGVVGFIWYKNSHKPATTVVNTTTEEQRVTVQDIDTTTSSIDKTLNSLNDSSDITSGDVSDQSLGL